MKSRPHGDRLSVRLVIVNTSLALLAGCAGIPTAGEKQAQQDQEAVERLYRPNGMRPKLPVLGKNSSLNDFLLFAILNQPQVEAAYFDWVASVRRITVERSLPDPRITFETDIASMVMALMPGFMMDFPGPGKLKARAGVATAESEAKYFQFESMVLQTAFALKKAYYNLHFLDAKIRVNQKTLQLVNELEKLARVQNEVGKVTLQDVLRSQIEQERLQTEIANLQDSRTSLLATWKASLGLKMNEVVPPTPAKFESTPFDVTSDRLFAVALTRNPRLKEMEAEVRQAEASLQLAYKARVPDFGLGVEADAKTFPVIFTPQIAITLPIWRDKIAAEIAAAQASKHAAEARLTAEQIKLAIEFAEKSFMFREASRNIQLLQDRLLPKVRQSWEAAQTGYASGKTDFLNVLDAERTLLQFQLAEVEARVQRELSVAELSLLIVGMPPTNSPILSPAKLTKKEKKS